MVQRWEPGVQYNYGDVVIFEGAQYKIIQPHRSQSDWTPPVTPALWGRVQGDYEGEYRREDKYGEDSNPSPPVPGYGQQQKQQYAADQQSYQTPPAQPPQEHKDWFGEHKKELEIGGGILAGAAALGAGLFAFKHHEQKGEEKHGQAWAHENWQAEALSRTQQWRAGKLNGPVAWILNEGKSIPRDAILGGEENGESIYICRVYYQGGIMVGKASSVFQKGAVIGFKKDEIQIGAYEILVGDSRAVRWVPCSGQVNPHSLGPGVTPVEGGREPDGHAIYIAQAPYHGAVIPGKACEVYGDGCFIPHDKTEKKVKEYAILCYA